MADIVEFIKSRLEEDEQIAKDPEWPSWNFEEQQGNLTINTGAVSMGWEFGGSSGVWLCDDPEDDCAEYRGYAEREATHIARHDPARVLREVAAKRALLGAHCTDPTYGGTECLGCHANFQEEHWTQDINECPTLRAIASVHSDHPDYDPAWSSE